MKKCYCESLLLASVEEGLRKIDAEHGGRYREAVVEKRSQSDSPSPAVLQMGVSQARGALFLRG